MVLALGCLCTVVCVCVLGCCSGFYDKSLLLLLLLFVAVKD